jgi:hypothetical protein
MAASQRVSRGFHRLLFLCAVCAASQSFATQITDMQTKFSMLCVAEKGTGFDWKDNDWVQTNYLPYSYIVTKEEPAKPDDPFGCHVSVSQQISPALGGLQGESIGCYQLKEIGEKDGLAYRCREVWNKTDNGYVLDNVSCEALFEKYKAELDGPFVRTLTYGLFFRTEKRDSVMLQIGKCSLLPGTPDKE